MKTILKSLCSALLMYSRIPAPKVEWKDENRRYALCFFPIIGAVIGVLLWGWHLLCEYFVVGQLLKAAVCCVIPIIVCGGIHLDGFCDVIDAQGSHKSREQKLEIMKDPHTGSFAMIGLCVYFLLQCALFSEIMYSEAVGVVCVGYVLSRSLSGLCAVTFKSARTNGTLASFTEISHKRVCVIVLSLVTGAACAGMLLIEPFLGAFGIVAAGLAVLFYRIFAYRQFGGITGDLAGFFLQICEIAILIAVVIAQFLFPCVELLPQYEVPDYSFLIF